MRVAAAKTQREVAAAVGVTERAYVRWEQGEALPDAQNLVRLADFFGVEPRELLPSALTEPEPAAEAKAEGGA